MTPSSRLRHFILLAFVASSIALAAATRPNIVFIFSDDHALQAIGAYGSVINRTPQIDRLAHEGAVFLNSFCANSICGPSRANILTGKHSYANGFLRNEDRFDGSQTTFPKLLQKAGYQTALVGKWHLGTHPTGFDFWEILPGQGNYYNPDFIKMDGTRHRRQGYCTDIVTDLAVDWLENQRDKDKPFVLMAQHKAPHRNWSPALRHLGMFKDQSIPVPATLRDDYSGRSSLLKENEMSIRNHFHWGHDMKFHGPNLFPDHFVSANANAEYNRMYPAEKQAWDAHYGPENDAFIEKMRAGAMNADDVLDWKYQRYIKDYLACIQAVDESVGRILDYLDKTGLAENTIVIYASDQGFYLGEHGWYDKRWMFEETLKMPFLIRWPNVIPPNTRATALIQNIDYAPTFLDLAGAPIPDDMHGRSLRPLLENQGKATPDWRDAIYYAYYENGAVHNVPIHDGVRTDRYKAMFFPRTREWQLFDLQTDTNEMQSLHNVPEYAGILAGLKKRYHDLRRFYGVNSAAIPASRGDEKGWRERQAKTNQRARRGGVDLAFIGDSITQGWESNGKAVWEKHFAHRNPINLGFGGDRTEHVLWRLQQGNLANISPKVAVVMIGTNNTGHQMQDPQEIAAGIRRILDLFHEKSPQTKVLLHGVFPRAWTPFDPHRLNNVAINQAIRRFADGDRVRYLDLGHLFLNPDGSLPKEIMPDALHLTTEGYRRWAEAIDPILNDMGL